MFTMVIVGIVCFISGIVSSMAFNFLSTPQYVRTLTDKETRLVKPIKVNPWRKTLRVSYPDGHEHSIPCLTNLKEFEGKLNEMIEGEKWINLTLCEKGFIVRDTRVNLILVDDVTPAQ